MPIFAWVIFGLLGLGALFGLAYALRALNCWLFRINELLEELRALRRALAPESMEKPADQPLPGSAG